MVRPEFLNRWLLAACLALASASWAVLYAEEELTPDPLPDPAADKLPEAERPSLPHLPRGAIREIPILQRKPETLAISPDGKYLTLGGAADGIEIIDLTTFQRLGILYPKSQGVARLAFSKDGKWLASGGKNGKVVIWDFKGAKAHQTIPPKNGPVSALAFGPESQRLMVGYDESNIGGLFRVEDASLIRELNGHNGRIGAAAFSADGRKILTEAMDSSARLWEAASGETLHVLENRDGSVAALTLSPDGGVGITTRGDRTWHVFDTDTGDDVSILTGQSENGSCVDFLPDGHTLLTGCLNGSLRQWDWSSGMELRYFQGLGAMQAVGVHPSGKYAITADSTGRCLVWDLDRPIPFTAAIPVDSTTPDRLEENWSRLASSQYGVRNAAMHDLLQSGTPALDLIIKKLTSREAMERENRVEDWIRDLDSDQFVKRENAQRELVRVQLPAREALERLMPTGSPEFRARAAKILASGMVSPEAFRDVLALEMLYWKRDQPGVLDALKKVAGGDRSLPLTQRAFAVLERIEKK